MPLLRRALPAASLTVVILAAGCSYQPPEISTEPPPNSESSVVLAADGSVLATLDAGEYRREVAFDDLPGTLVDAVVAAEDRRFWTHGGIDVRAIVRAANRNIAEGEVVEGGSTITQQYVKLTLLNDEQTLDRKIREASLAMQLEREHDKQEILTAYLNVIYLGAGAYGVGAAADVYFGKAVGDLDLAESALLAGLIRAPSDDQPFAAPERAVQRRRDVLDAMVDTGAITTAERDAADAADVALVARPADRRYRAGHFVEEVKRFVLASPAFGATREDRIDRLYRGGLVIETTLDPVLQRQAELAVDRVLADPDGPTAAMVSMDPGTGNVLAMVGGSDFFGDQPAAQFNLATQGQRPAGSSFKPILLAAALEEGGSLDDVYAAPPTITIPVRGGEWVVDNYDQVNGGRVDLVDATVHSYNTVYARLVTEVGPSDLVSYAARLGVDTPLLAVPSAALGSNEVTALDMATVYATLANRGAHVEPTVVTEVRDRTGRVVYRHVPRPEQVMAAAVADAVTDVLVQVIERGTGIRARIGRPAAGKTGTGQEWGDAWFVGYTPELSTSVWVGFPEGQVSMVPPTTTISVTGGSWPARIWQLYTTAALADRPVTEFASPAPTEPDRDDAPTTGTPARPGLRDVRGLPLEPAADSLARDGFVVAVEEVPDDQYPPGVIVSTDPPPGDPVAGGATVTVRVANGQAVRRVPPVLGLSGTDAITLLERAGFEVDLVETADPDAEAAVDRAGLVWRQAPSSGTPADHGDTVQIRVNPTPAVADDVEIAAGPVATSP